MACILSLGIWSSLSYANNFSKTLPNSGTEVTLGTTDSVLGDFSKDGADLENLFCPDSSTMFGRTLVGPPAVLGPHVFPLTPSAGTEMTRQYYLINGIDR